ncbi:MAG: DMT family transporter [Rhizobiaceae bacterium]
MHPSQKGVAAATLASLCWGSATVMSKYALDDVSPVALLTLQLAASTACLWLVVWLRQVSVPRLMALAPIAILGLLEPGLAYLLGLIALTDVGAGSATLILASEAIMIVIVSAVLFRQLPGALFAVLSVIAFAGLVMALGLWDAGNEENGVFGVVLMFLATASAAFYVVLSGRIADTQDPVVAVTAQQTVALAAVLVILPLEIFGRDAGVSMPKSPETWFVVIASGIIQYGIAFSLYMYALSKIPANLAGSFLNLIPVFGLSIAFVALGEALSMIQLTGAAITILALTVINLKAEAVVEPAETGHPDMPAGAEGGGE